MGEAPFPVQAASFDGLTARQFHDIVRLREAVFVVEQGCAYAEVDGRDILPGTIHWWIEDGGEVVAYLRLYPGAEDADWIGRVVTAPGQRHRGLAAQLMQVALDSSRRPVRIAAQSWVASWYERFGFRPCGAEFDDDGIPHTPMRRP